MDRKPRFTALVKSKVPAYNKSLLKNWGVIIWLNYTTQLHLLVMECLYNKELTIENAHQKLILSFFSVFSFILCLCVFVIFAILWKDIQRWVIILWSYPLQDFSLSLYHSSYSQPYVQKYKNSSPNFIQIS